MSKIQQLLKAAINVAKLSNSPRFRMGAAAHKYGHVYAVGKNSYTKTDPKATNWSQRQHAEFHLARADVEGSTVMVVRLTKTGRLAMARPCRHCEVLLRPARRVLYTDGRGNVVDLRTNEIVGTTELTYNFIPKIRI